MIGTFTYRRGRAPTYQRERALLGHSASDPHSTNLYIRDSTFSPILKARLGMKELICMTSITLLCILGAADGRAQYVAGDTLDAPHRLAKDAWALQFGVSSHSLGSYLGSTISAKHHFSAGRALRYGLSIRADYRDREDVGSIHNVNVGLVTQYVVYPRILNEPGADLHLFYGVGPEVGLSARSAGQRDEISISIGAVGSIGAEWFVKTRISLSAEYITFAAIVLGDSTKEFRFNSNGGRLGLSVYF